MTSTPQRISLLLRTLVAVAVVCAGGALEPTPARASQPAAQSARAAAPTTTDLQSFPQPTLASYLPKSYRKGDRRALRHYRDLQARSAAAACCDWWSPKAPWEWIKEKASFVIEAYDVAKWWLAKGFKCGAAVASVWVAGGGKIAQIALKISRLAKSDEKVRRTRRAIRKLGGIRSAMKVLGRYAKSRGGDVSTTEKYWVGVLVKSGGAVVANLLGVSSCVDMAKRIL